MNKSIEEWCMLSTRTERNNTIVFLGANCQHRKRVISGLARGAQLFSLVDPFIDTCIAKERVGGKENDVTLSGTLNTSNPTTFSCTHTVILYRYISKQLPFVTLKFMSVKTKKKKKLYIQTNTNVQRVFTPSSTKSPTRPFLFLSFVVECVLSFLSKRVHVVVGRYVVVGSVCFTVGQLWPIQNLGLEVC